MTVPTGSPNQITYKLTGIFRFERIAELPLNNVTFSRVLCGVGPWAASLNSNDREVQRSNWIAATSPWRAALWIDIDGVLVYGGPVTGRHYVDATGQVALSGFDFAGYLSQRLQSRDYSSYEDPEGHKWNAFESGAPAMSIAYFILKQALSVANSIPIKVTKSVANAPGAFFINFSAPIEQSQTLASLLSQLQELGYLVGLDYTVEYAYADGSPSVEIALWYPRATGTSKPVFDLDNALDYDWPEDGTQTANRIVELAGATTDRTSGKEYGPAEEAGYPLLETTISHSALAPTAEGNRAQLEAYASGDLAACAFPFVVPSVTVPMLGRPSIKDLAVGGDAQVIALPHAGDLPLTNPRFPAGLDILQRVVRIDGVVPDEGIPTMVVAFNPPPTRVPVEPAETRAGGGGPTPPEKWKETEKEREEEEREEKEREEEEREEKEREEKELGKGTIVLRFKPVRIPPVSEFGFEELFNSEGEPGAPLPLITGEEFTWKQPGKEGQEVKANIVSATLQPGTANIGEAKFVSGTEELGLSFKGTDLGLVDGTFRVRVVGEVVEVTYEVECLL